jgi:hypothetical protein
MLIEFRLEKKFDIRLLRHHLFVLLQLHRRLQR